jgi:hypothetical protein
MGPFLGAQWIHVHWLRDSMVGECAKLYANVCPALESRSDVSLSLVMKAMRGAPAAVATCEASIIAIPPPT